MPWCLRETRERGNFCTEKTIMNMNDSNEDKRATGKTISSNKNQAMMNDSPDPHASIKVKKQKSHTLTSCS